MPIIQHKQGFTIIEVVLVLAIAGCGAPSFTSFAARYR